MTVRLCQTSGGKGPKKPTRLKRAVDLVPPTSTCGWLANLFCCVVKSWLLAMINGIWEGIFGGQEKKTNPHPPQNPNQNASFSNQNKPHANPQHSLVVSAEAQAMDILQQAGELERKGQLVDAQRHYTIGLEVLMDTLKVQTLYTPTLNSRNPTILTNPIFSGRKT